MIIKKLFFFLSNVLDNAKERQVTINDSSFMHPPHSPIGNAFLSLNTTSRKIIHLSSFEEGRNGEIQSICVTTMKKLIAKMF